MDSEWTQNGHRMVQNGKIIETILAFCVHSDAISLPWNTVAENEGWIQIEKNKLYPMVTSSLESENFFFSLLEKIPEWTQNGSEWTPILRARRLSGVAKKVS